MAKKLSKTEQWMLDHPDDEPPPRYAHAWRSRRFGALAKAESARHEAERKRYEAAMAETRRLAVG